MSASTALASLALADPLDILLPLVLLAANDRRSGETHPTPSLVPDTDSETAVSAPGIVEIAIRRAVAIYARRRTS